MKIACTVTSIYHLTHSQCSFQKGNACNEVAGYGKRSSARCIIRAVSPCRRHSQLSTFLLRCSRYLQLYNFPESIVMRALDKTYTTLQLGASLNTVIFILFL